jgi:hypothetical protein
MQSGRFVQKTLGYAARHDDTACLHLFFLILVKGQLFLIILVVVLSLVVYLPLKEIKGNGLGSDSVVFPFRRYHLGDCEALETNASLRDTDAASNEPRVNTFDSLNCRKRLLASMVMLTSSVFSITIPL